MGLWSALKNRFTGKKKAVDHVEMKVKPSQQREATAPPPGLLSKTISRSELRLSSQNLRQEKHARLKQIKKKLSTLRKASGVKISHKGGGLTPLCGSYSSLIIGSLMSICDDQSGICNPLCDSTTSLIEAHDLHVQLESDAYVTEVIAEEASSHPDVQVHLENQKKKQAMRKAITKTKRSKLRAKRMQQEILSASTSTTNCAAKKTNKLVKCSMVKNAKSVKLPLKTAGGKKRKDYSMDRDQKGNPKHLKEARRVKPGVGLKAMTVESRSQLRTYARRRPGEIKPPKSAKRFTGARIQPSFVACLLPHCASQHPRGETVPQGQDPLALDLHDEIDMRGGFLPGYTPEDITSAIARSEDNLVSSEISDSELNSPETSQQRLDRAERTAMFGRITAFMRSQFDEYFNNRSHGPGSHLAIAEPDVMYGIEVYSSYSGRTMSSAQFAVEE